MNYPREFVNYATAKMVRLGNHTISEGYLRELYEIMVEGVTEMIRIRLMSTFDEDAISAYKRILRSRGYRIGEVTQEDSGMYLAPVFKARNRTSEPVKIDTKRKLKKKGCGCK